MTNRKPIMVNEKVYTNLKKFLDVFSKETGKMETFGDVIDLLLREPSFLYSIDKRLRDYILSFTGRLVLHSNIMGILLFGSVTRGNYTPHRVI